MANIINFPNKTKKSNDQEINTTTLYQNTYSLIEPKKRETIKVSDKLFQSLINILGSDKTVEILLSQENHIYLYWFSISHNFKDGAINEILHKIKDLSTEKICEFLYFIYAAQINKLKDLELIVNVAISLKGQESLINALKVENDYIKFILNKCHFNQEEKISSLINSCKVAEGSYVIKNGNLFINTQKDGNISELANIGSGESRALGIYCDDIQYLNSYDLSLEYKNNNIIDLNPITYFESGYKSYLRLTDRENLTIIRKKIIHNSFFEKIYIKNKSKEPVKAYIGITADIKDLFEVRAKISTDEKIICNEIRENNCTSIECTYKSGRKYGIKTDITSKIAIKREVNHNKIRYELTIPAEYNDVVYVKITPTLNSEAIDSGLDNSDFNNYDEAYNHIKESKKSLMPKIKIEGKINNIQKIVNRALCDMEVLTNNVKINNRKYSYIAAGLPRYSALFGRDSIITALKVLKYNPEIAKNTIELLALFQGEDIELKYKRELDEINNSNWCETTKNAAIKGIKELYLQREEDKGKILHELRVGELSKTASIPHSPYYGTVDATPLWIWLVCEYVNYTNDYELFNKYSSNLVEAINWIKRNMTDGFLRFSGSSSSKVKIKNQGWKDAGDSIKHIITYKGNLSNPLYPIALAEVQGYVYKAFTLLSDIQKKLNNNIQANQLKKSAETLKDNFNKEYWCGDICYYSMALDKNNNPVKNISSNIGHCLLTDIVDDEKKIFIEQKLMSDEMFSGWGIRTLSESHPAYDPISYHNGSVWTHDTAMCAKGMNNDNKNKILKALLQAANNYENNRLPELFGGFKKVTGQRIVQYPEACSPQAWSSASILWLLSDFIDNNNIPSYIDKIII